MAIGAALSAFGGLVGGLASAGANLYMNERNNEANAAQARMQNQWNIEQWNRENEYNLPVNQVQRMKDAGINPALAYANGQMMNEAAQSPDMTSAAGQLRAGYIDPMLMAQIGLINAQKEKTETESDVMAQKLPEELDKLRNENKQIVQNCENLQQSLVNAKQELENMKTQQHKTEEEIASEVFNRTMREKEFQETCRVNTATINKMAQDILESKARVPLLQAERKYTEALANLSQQEYEYNAKANAFRLLQLKMDLVNSGLDAKLKIDTHTLYGQQIKLNMFDVNEGTIRDLMNQDLISEFKGEKGRWNKFATRSLFLSLRSVDELTNSIKLFRFGK